MAATEFLDGDFHRCVAELSSLPVIAEIFSRLQRELPQSLTYHSAKHAADVMAETVLFAMAEGIDGAELEDLAIAAAYHDAGFLEFAGDNEEVAGEMAGRAMEQHGYAAERIQRVKAMILDTRLVETPVGRVQQPHEPLSCYLLDGDLGNLGREDFFEKLQLYQQETGVERKPALKNAHQLLITHHWFTEAAWRLRQDKKAANLRGLEQLMATEGIGLDEPR